MNGTKTRPLTLLQRHLAELPTERHEAVTRPLFHEQPTEKAPALTDDTFHVQRLRRRANALHMDFADYLDMLIEEDYLAWLRWQRRQIARDMQALERSEGQ